MPISIAIMLGGTLVFLAHLFVVLFRRTRIPDTLLLVSIGVLLGPVLGWVSPESLGKVGPALSLLALAIILFEGGQETRLSILRNNWRFAAGLILPLFLATMLIGAWLVHVTTGLGPNRALLLGAILGSTSPSVIVPMARHLNMKVGPRLVLTLETALTDVLCVVLVLGFMEAHKAGSLNITLMASKVLASFMLSAMGGITLGLIWSLCLTRLRNLQNNIFLTLALVFVLFGAAEWFHLSGGIAVLCFGAAITNSTGLNVARLAGGRFGAPSAFTDREKAFFSEAVFLLKTFFFVYLGLSLHLGNPALLGLAFGLTCMKILIRVPMVRLAMPRSTERRDASLMSVMASKGLASAVLASLPLQQGLAGGQLIRDLTYSVVLISIILNAVLVFLVDKTGFGTAFGLLFGGFQDRPEGDPETAQETPIQVRETAPTH